jgi:hypothetical protein
LVAVDDEGHVVVHHLDDGVGRLPAVRAALRVVGLQLEVARRALAREAQLRERGAREIGGIRVAQVLGRDVAEVMPEVGVEIERAVGGVRLRLPLRNDAIDHALFVVGRPPLWAFRLELLARL